MNGNNHKQVVAVGGKATYRRVEILTTADGCLFFWNSKPYPCKDLGEATAAIDAIYATLQNVLVVVEADAVPVQ